ncbi:MAG: lytic transglycosylase domain-containing protein [Thiomicrospira sp.]|nr:lytic transglycosylase domain-containing protein [Thiomicrospira sp.]
MTRKIRESNFDLKRLTGLFLMIGVIATPTSVFSSNTGGSDASLDALIHKCLPRSHHHIMKAIVRVESSGQKYAINVNGGKNGNYSKTFSKKTEAKKAIRQLMEKGYNFDTGLAQINSTHFRKDKIFGKIGLTPLDALEPCNNLKMGAAIFSDNFRRYGTISEALSAYNTGNRHKGFENGYIKRYLPKE